MMFTVKWHPKDAGSPVTVSKHFTKWEAQEVADDLNANNHSEDYYVEDK